MNIKKLPCSERPREKLIKHGPRVLSNSELLAIILRTGNKKENVLEISNKFFSKYNLKSFSKLKISMLKKQLGIGDAKACQIIATFELGKRLSSFIEDEKVQIKNARDIFKIFSSEISYLNQEHFIGVYLNARKQIIKKRNTFHWNS